MLIILQTDWMIEYTIIIIAEALEPLGATSVITYLLKFQCEKQVDLI